MKKILVLLMVSLMPYCFSQSSIVASGTDAYTIGETFPIMQTDLKNKEVSLSIPKYEYPIEPPKPIVEKKKSLWQKIIEAFKKVFKIV